MMYPDKFENLTVLKEYIVNAIAYTEEEGFYFAGIKPGMSIEEVPPILGKPEIFNTESEQQQTIQYNAFIDHPAHGRRDHFKLNTLFWAFNREPFKIIKLHFDTHKTGDDAINFKNFLHDFFDAILEKFGKPDKKTLRKNREEIVYKNGKYKLSIWNNAEGVRITLT